MRRMLGSVFPSKYDLEGDIQEKYALLKQLEEIRSLQRHKGWLAIERVFMRWMAEIDASIVQHSENPVKHEKELRSNWALRTAYKAVIGTVHAPDATWAEVSKQLDKKLKLYKEIAGQPRASDLETTPEPVS